MEVRDVATRPRLRIPIEIVEEFAERLFACGEEVAGVLPLVTDCRDPEDNYVLSLAIEGAAAVILTEDLDLLALHPWRGVRILRLHEFLNRHSLHATDS